MLLVLLFYLKRKKNHPPLTTILYLVPPFNFWWLWRILRFDSSQLFRVPKYIIFYGPCTKYTYIKRPLNFPNHTLTTIHFMFLSQEFWAAQDAVRWHCDGMKTMIGEYSFNPKVIIKHKKEVDFNFCTYRM